MDPVLLETIILNQIKSYRGQEFQEFGDRLLSKLYPGEYTAVRAGGPWGDLKNDGYCYVNRTFFHFYATSQYNVSTLKAKITADVEGCLQKQQQVKKIVYVSNDAGLGVIEAHIDALRLEHGIPIETWGPHRLVEIIRRLPVRDIGTVMRMPLANVVTKNVVTKATDIIYTIEENSIKIYTEKYVTRRGDIAVWAFIGLILALFLLYRPLPFGWYLLIVLILFGVSAGLNWYGTMSEQTASGKEYQRGVDFYVKEGDHYKSYRKKALCSYPNCDGVVYLGEPPEKEAGRFKVIGYCSSNRKQHTFTYSEKNTGSPVKIDFRPKPTK